jgi:RNA polymerase sigma factor (TIGR02999 family)
VTRRLQSDGKPGGSEPQAAPGLLASRTASPEIRLIAAELLPAFYDQLKHIAQRARSRLGGNNTLQTTALVHEAYLRLRHSSSFADKTHFLRAAALAMRHALINYAAARIAEKRGGGQLHLTLSSAEAVGVDTDEGLLALNEALERLADEIPRLADVIECRFFGGYGEEDTARALGLSLRTVQRDWLKARAWLYRELGGPL